MSNSYLNHTIGYRAEIDGLRAIAVLPVVLYHAGMGVFDGGFVGVDVFFVISGYLITLILAKEISQRTFSVAGFYERRIRRLYPALIAMFAVCWLLAMLLMMPHDMRAFARSMIASTAFSSNLLFWAEGGYFDTSSDLKPLLHTWSLSVEEQYYIFFPLLLLWLKTRVTRWRAVLGGLFLVSLLACVFYTDINVGAAFYLPVFRIWELLLGSFVALGIAFPRFASIKAKNILAVVGTVFIMVAIFTFSEQMAFPGWRAVIPCLGAALIVAYSGGTATGRVLSCTPLVWFGRISYSLYLWHWPIIVFYKYYTMRELSPIEQVLVVLLSVLIAYASMRYIETPFRVHRLAASRRSVFSLATGTTLILLFGSFGAYLSGGLPNRLPEQVQRLASGARDVNPLRKTCDARSVKQVNVGDVCPIGAENEKPTFAILGDSFGDALVPGVANAAADTKKKGLILTSSGCYPLLGIVDLNKRGDRTCQEFVAASLNLIRNTASITDVILVGRWTTAAMGTRFGASSATDWFLQDAQSTEIGYAENQRVFSRSLARTLAALEGKRVHIVSYIPEQRVDPPRTLGMCAYLGRNCAQGVGIDDYNRRQQYVRQVLTGLAGQQNVSIIDIGKKLCTGAACNAVANGQMLYSDDNHLSRTGAIYLKDLFQPIFFETGQQK